MYRGLPSALTTPPRSRSGRLDVKAKRKHARTTRCASYIISGPNNEGEAVLRRNANVPSSECSGLQESLQALHYDGLSLFVHGNKLRYLHHIIHSPQASRPGAKPMPPSKSWLRGSQCDGSGSQREPIVETKHTVNRAYIRRQQKP